MEGTSSKSYPLRTFQRDTDTEGTKAFAPWSWLMENIAGLQCVFLRKRKPWRSNPIGEIQLGSKVSKMKEKNRQGLWRLWMRQEAGPAIKQWAVFKLDNSWVYIYLFFLYILRHWGPYSNFLNQERDSGQPITHFLLTSPNTASLVTLSLVPVRVLVFTWQVWQWM